MVYFLLNHGYDTAGNRSSMTVSGYYVGYTENYSYDKNNSLTSSVRQNSGQGYDCITDYSYDKNGNQLRIDKYTKNRTGKFQISVADAYSETAETGSQTFAYNGLNQLVSYTNTNE